MEDGEEAELLERKFGTETRITATRILDKVAGKNAQVVIKAITSAHRRKDIDAPLRVYLESRFPPCLTEK